MCVLSLGGIIKLLHRLGFSYTKQKLIPSKLDVNTQEEFELEYSLLKGNLGKDDAIYFMDSIHPQHQTRCRLGWTRKNVVKTLLSFSGWKRKHIIGAINLKDSDVVTTDNLKVNCEYIIEFLKKLEEINRDKLSDTISTRPLFYHSFNIMEPRSCFISIALYCNS